MPDGPNVDLNLGPAPVAPTNPIASAEGLTGIMSNLAEVRNRQNANVLFQQQMSAMHQLGDDLAVWSSQGLSPEEQIDRASHQPYAPYITPQLANFRASNLAGVQVQETQARVLETKQRMANAGLGPLAQALEAAQGDPAKLGEAFKVATAGLPPELQKSLAPAYSAMAKFATTNLPDDPKLASAKVQENLRNLGMSLGGLPLDKVFAMGGGVPPTITEVPTSSGASVKGVVSGTGNFSPLGVGPSTSQQEQMRIAGQQAAGLPPTFQTVKGPQGQDIPTVVSGGGGGAPATTSPLLAPGAGPSVEAPPPEAKSGPFEGRPDPSQVVMGPTLAAGEFLKKTGELGGDLQEELNENAHTLPTIAKRVDLMSQALTQFQAGGFADTREGLAKMAQGLRNAGLDISQDTIDKISNGSLSGQQVFQSLVSRAGVQALKADAQGTGRVMRSEVDRYLEMMGDTNDPKALTTLINNLRYTLLVGYDQGQKFLQFKQSLARGDPSVKGLDVADFPHVYNRDFDENNLVTPKGISLAPIASGTFKGSAEGGKVTHRWNPTTGSVEEVK